MTQYHSYNTPKQGTTDWHLPLNENFEKIDADIEIRDKEDNLDQYSPKTNAKFLATDTGRIYLSADGSDWVKLGSVSEEGTDVKIAETASDIQPAIDELSEQIVNNTTTQGDMHSGVVKLRAKDYHPETTIWLKRGVILEGSVATPWQKTTRGGTDATHQQRTTIFTDQMPEGPGALYPEDGANTWRHFDTVNDHRDFDNGKISGDSELEDVTHPHLAVINAFDQIPVNSDTERTDYQKRHVGYGTGLRNLNLDARAKQRWWDPANESGSDKRKATYFGVYDAIIMERVNGILVENVNTIGFLGYNGFYQDTQGIISRGNHYGGSGGGTATDHHGATLQLDYSFRDYVKGAWSVDVTGPAPAVRLSGHVTEKFVDGAWRQKPTLTGTDPVYLGSESAFENGNAPLVEPHENDYVVLHEDQQTIMDGYRIRDGSSRGLNGVLVDDNSFRFRNGSIGVNDTAIVGANESGMEITNSELAGTLGLKTTNHQGTLRGVTFKSDDAVKVGNANFNGGYYNCYFKGNRGVVDSQNDISMVFWNPNFTSLSDVTVTDSATWRDDASERLVFVDPIGYSNMRVAKETISGDGSASFAITHQMDEVPQAIDITAMSEDATGDAWVTNANETDFTIRYSSAPPSGDDNLEWTWKAYGWSHPALNQI